MPALAAPTLSSPHPPHHQDEDFINRSLLDSLDAQADAEPINSADADTTGPISFKPSSESSPGSSSVPYPLSLHSQHHMARPDSPSDHSKNIIHQLHSQDSQFSTAGYPSGLYGHSSNMHLQDFSNEFETTKQHVGKHNGFGANNNFRSFASYPITNRPHHQLNQSVIGATSFRDTHTFYPPSTDVFPSQMTSPIQSHLQPYESHSNFDFGNQQASLNGASKGYLDQFNPNQSSLLSHHASTKANGTLPHQSKFNNHQFGNSVQLTSQTPYGPHVPAGGNTAHTNVPTSNNATASTATNNSNQEEISTIFVVGFPEDMQEREFQNMFTFSPGFEAATLKIPNKEYTAYGANGLRGYQGYNGSNDPYNLVTVNQGGVVVDGGRDGTMSSWPTSGDDGTGAHFVGGNVAPRKQIIGFAKFKSREAAIEARDVLQGRRVDIEKGAVLKAEMAKKNLHTKRGVGPVAGPAQNVALPPPNPLGNVPHLNGVPVPNHHSDPFTITDPFGSRGGELPLGGIDLGRMGTYRDQLQRDVHAITAGIASSATEFHPRKERDEEEQRRRDGMFSAMGFGTAIGQPTRGPRERAEEDERERRRKEEVRDRLRASNSTAFDAFHSVPAGNAPALSRQNSGLNGVVNGGALLPPSLEASTSLGNSPLLGNAFASHKSTIGQPLSHNEETVGPWDKIPNKTVNGHSSSSERSISPQENQDPRYSPPADGQVYEQPVRPQRTHSDSSASSVVGGPVSAVVGGPTSSPPEHADGALAGSMSELVLNTEQGNTSPQLPSPASGASSTSTRNAIDQNPPINTLYVGNLPAPSPSITYSPDHLEDALRALFQTQPGYRRLCFRQKNNGPMCFVEFEDVTHATKALNELYGNTLGGLVKGGGIRLSYSKNPLGVRTPTSATSPNGSLQQQQSMQSLSFGDQFSVRAGDDVSQQHTSSHNMRRDVGSPFGSSFMTSPPPRFQSPPNSFGQTTLTSPTNAFSLRTNGGSLSGLYSYSLGTAGGLSS